ncbi:Lipoprotein signal peptidase [wastewater metagenome]|uniref:Lipoprotein signal peptidase n=2 Tax=unclassified sequences TaxID=12908 RepID=A0A5B8RJU9_9ZZZZ|nr:lipoprotein signal peptidase [uncultured organism]
MLRFGLIIAALVLAADQATKYWAATALMPYRPVPVMPSFNLTLSFNTGAAFSLLADGSGWQRWLFTALALAVSAYLIWWLRTLRPGERLVAAALGLVLGGALGNVLDRMVHGYVIDFLDVYAGNWHWPAFNVADSAISVGVAMLVISVVLGRRV